MSAGSPLKHLSKQSEIEDLPPDLVSQTTIGLPDKERSPMNLYNGISGNILQADVQDNSPPNNCDTEGSSPFHIRSGGSVRKNTSPKETLFSVMEYQNLQPGYVSPNNGPNLRVPGEKPQPLEYASTPQSANRVSDRFLLQQTYGKGLANPSKPEAYDQLERAHEHQTAASSSFLESSEGMLTDGSYLLTPKMRTFMPPHKKLKMAVTNPNAFFKAACDSIAKLRTSFDHYIMEKMEALGRLAPDLLWTDTRSSPEALEAMEVIQATAASCDYIVKFLNWSPARLSAERGQWRLRPKGAGWIRGCRPSRQRKGRLLKLEKFSQRAALKFFNAKLGKFGPKRKRVGLKVSKYNQKA